MGTNTATASSISASKKPQNTSIVAQVDLVDQQSHQGFQEVGNDACRREGDEDRLEKAQDPTEEGDPPDRDDPDDHR
ncbi:MAG: hypothetical protein R3F31_18460 [Verrucomicrobiales bacterium]